MGERNKRSYDSADIQSVEELPEYRIYVESDAGEPVAWDIRGQSALETILEHVCKDHPGESVYVREVSEKVVLVVRPDRSITTFD